MSELQFGQTAQRTAHSTQDQNVLAAVAEGELLPDSKQKAIERRARNRVRGLNHHAYQSRNAEETRHFYEDILEMPMTVFMTIPEEAVTGAPLPYCHFFFEMGDGSSIAFFDYPAFHEGKVSFEPTSGYNHHVALQVNGDEELAYFKKKLEDHGVQCMYMDHGAFHSLYFVDPNGLNLELCSTPPIAEEFFLRAEKLAARELKKWMEDRPNVRRV